jgi:hypothetical protein
MELNTYGDLKKAIQAITKQQRNEKVGNTTVDIITGLIPYADAAKNTLGVIKAFFGKPDTVKTKTWLDKIDVDDEFSAIVDDTVENAFLKITANIIDNEPDTKPLEDDFNMNQKLVNYLKEKFEGRTVTGIQESNTYNKSKKMKNEALKKLIKEEIKNIISETELKGAANLKPLIQQLPGVDINDFQMAYNAVKTGKNLSMQQVKAMSNAMIGLIRSNDDQLLTKIMTQLKNLESK